MSVSDYFLVGANKRKKPFHSRKLRFGAKGKQKNWLLKEDFSLDFKHGKANEIFYNKKSIMIWFATLSQLLTFRESIWSLYRIMLMHFFVFLILLDIFISYCGLFSIQCLLFAFKSVSGKRFVVFFLHCTVVNMGNRALIWFLKVNSAQPSISSNLSWAETKRNDLFCRSCLQSLIPNSKLILSTGSHKHPNPNPPNLLIIPLSWCLVKHGLD